METFTLQKKELEDLVENAVHKAVQETIAQIFINEHTLNTLLEAMEDKAFGKLMEEGETGEYVDESEFMEKLNRKIAALS